MEGRYGALRSKISIKGDGRIPESLVIKLNDEPVGGLCAFKIYGPSPDHPVRVLFVIEPDDLDIELEDAELRTQRP
jgi:hypothetical protein